MHYVIILFCRPIAGSVNLCPDAIQGNDMEQVIATLKHELLHAMVCIYELCTSQKFVVVKKH